MPPRRRFNAHEKRLVAARQGWKCGRCACVLSATFEVDHIVALHKGGADDYERNAEALCRECHARKTQREEVERLRTCERLRTRGKRAPLWCSRCGKNVSPFFLHACD